MKVVSALFFFTVGFLTACVLIDRSDASDRMEDIIREGYESD